MYFGCLKENTPQKCISVQAKQIAAYCGQNAGVFLQKAFSLSTWSSADFSWALRYLVWCEGFFLAQQSVSLWRSKTRLTADTVTCPPVTSTSLWFSVDCWPPWPILSQQQVIVCIFFLIVAVTVLYTLHFKAIICTVYLGTCNCFEMASSDFLDKSLCSYRSILSPLDFPIIVFVAESNWPRKVSSCYQS